MPELSLTVSVDAPVDRVWAALTDWDRQGEWMLGTRVRGTKRDGQGVGGEIEAVTGIGPVGVPDHMQVIRWEPPHVCLVRHRGRVIRGTGSFMVRARGTGSSVLWAEQLDLPLGRLGRLGWPLARPGLRWGLELSLRRFARWAPTHSG